MLQSSSTSIRAKRLWRFWLGVAFLPILHIALPVWLYLSNEHSSKSWFVIVGLPLIGIWLFISDLLPTLRSSLVLTERGLCANVANESIEIMWRDIKAIEFIGWGDKRTCILITDTGEVDILLKSYDEKSLIIQLKHFLSETVFGAGAWKASKQFSAWISKAEDFLKINQGPAKTRAYGALLGQLVLPTIVLGLGVLAGIIAKVTVLLVICLALLVAMGLLYALAYSEVVIVDKQQICLQTIFRRHAITWSEVKDLYIDETNKLYAFVGLDKRLVISSDFVGEQAGMVDKMIAMQARLRDYPLNFSRSLTLLRSKNCVVINKV